MYTNNKNTKYVSSSRVIHIIYARIPMNNVPGTVYFLFLKECTRDLKGCPDLYCTLLYHFSA